jgi:O-antigen/teichoic acid export membrane protein
MAVARNVIANTAGTVVLVGAGAALTILSFRLAGAEQYGLIGFYLMLNGIVAILDTGLAPGVVREVARARAGQHSEKLNTILFTFQGVYLAITAITALILVALAPLIAGTWLKTRTISTGEVELALILGAAVLALQRQRTVYQVFLDGMEHQVTANAAQSATSLLRAVVVLGAMLAVAPTAIVFLSASLLTGAIELTLFATLAWRAARGEQRSHFSFGLIRGLWRYLLTSTLAVALGALLVNVDKIVVSAALPLEVVGRYIFIAQICLIVLKLVTPNVTAIFPRLTAAVGRGARDETIRVYFAGTQTAAIIVAVFMLGASYFGYEALLVLTGNPAVAQTYHPVFALMAWGYGLNSLALIPNALRMVEGFPGTALWGNAAAAVLYVPAVALLTPRYGLLAPVTLWLAVNAGLFGLFTLRAHRHMLAGQAWNWLSGCILRQTVAIAVVFAVAHVGLRGTASMPVKIAGILAATATAMLVAIALSAELRHSIISFVRRLVAARADADAQAQVSPQA